MHMQQAVDNPDLVQVTKQAAYALYRPEPPQHSKVPLNTHDAIRKYRMDPPRDVFTDDRRNRSNRVNDMRRMPQGRGHQRGRSYAGAGGMVSYLGTGDGNRTVKSKRDQEFVHGTGF